MSSVAKSTVVRIRGSPKLRACHVRGTVLNVFHLLGQVILSLQPPNEAVLFYPQLIDEESETQRNKIT